MRVQCRPLAMETGRVHFNLTTVINQSEALVYFFLDKSCNGRYNLAINSYWCNKDVPFKAAYHDMYILTLICFPLQTL